MTITLKPLNNRFKRLIHDHGAEWIAVRAPRPMPCFHGMLGVTAHPIGNPGKLSNFRLEEIRQ